MTADVELLRERLQDYADGLGAPPVLLHDVGELVALLREADAKVEALQGAYLAQLAERANEIRLREKAEANTEALRAEVAEARPSEAGYRAGVFPGDIANPADVDGADSGDWYCERHPESLQDHDGCEGAGMPSSARIPMLVHQVRMLMQELRERDLQYGFLARAALHPAAAQED